MNTYLRSVLLVCLLCLPAPAVRAAAVVTYVGDNPYPGFANTGGTGTVAQGAGTATVEKTFTSLGDLPVIIDGGPTPSAGPSIGMDMIRINERVENRTGVTWTDFHLVVEPIDASPSLSVDFLNVSNPTGDFDSWMVMPGGLWFFGEIPDGTPFYLSFDLKISSPPGSFYLFGIHEFPTTIPEPSSLVFVAMSAMALVVRNFCPILPGRHR